MIRNQACLRLLAGLVLVLGFVGSVGVAAEGELPFLVETPDTASWDTPPTAEDELSSLVESLRGESAGEVRIKYHPFTGTVRFMGTEPGPAVKTPAKLSPGVSPEVAAMSFLDIYGPAFGIKNQSKELSVMRSKHIAGQARSFVRFQQQYNGVPVMGGELIVQVKNNNVVSINGETVPDIYLGTEPVIGADEARETALGAVSKWYNEGDGAGLRVTDPELWIYNPVLLGMEMNRNFLVWRMEVASTELEPINELVLVDANLGGIALHFNQIADAKNRIVYDNNNDNTTGLPGTAPVRTEGAGATGITDVDLAYDYAGDTYDFYNTTHGRDGIDGSGMDMVSTVRYCPSSGSCPYANAFWNGTQMVYGEGYASADDVVGHELTHGVTEYESGLYYYMQSGAINEHFSDMWGEFVDLTNGAGNDTAGVRWLMGENLSIGAIRDMSDPTAYSDPDKMTSLKYACGLNDSGGVHSNSGVGNKLAYLLVDGDSFNGKTITAIGMNKTAKIFYEAQTNMLTSGSDYADLADALRQSCLNLNGTAGINSSNCQQVENAILAVEMDQQPTSCTATEAPVCDTGSPVNLFFDDMENTSSGNWAHGNVSGIVDEWYYPANVNPYSYDATYATSGVNNFWGYDYWNIGDYAIAMTADVTLPADTGYMHFNHSYRFDYFSSYYYDGGVVEYSTDGGSNWNDTVSLFTHNGYTGTLNSSYSNPLGGREAFTDISNGYISSRLNLSTLAGQSVRFRFRIGTDSSIGQYGWFIDDVRIYTCSDITPPAINIISPQNTTYEPGTPITITYGSNESIVEQDYYSLDGGANMTFDNGTTAITPDPGSHSITVWANDTSGNGGSDTKYFTVVDWVAVNSCQVINSSGEYVLNKSILNSGVSGACINVTVSNVVFDGQGYTIDGIDTSNTYGVYVHNSSAALTNVIVKNLNVTNWTYGIYYHSMENGSIENNNASNNDRGIYLESSSNNTLTNNTVNSNTWYGIYLGTSSNNTLTNNNASNNYNGIYLSSSSNNTLTNNNASSNTNYGIYLWASSDNTLADNTASNTNYGIYLESSSNNNTITDNTASLNTWYGIYLESSSNNTLTNNNVSNNGDGIYLSSSSNNTLTNNTASNSDTGIYLESSSNNTLTNNTLYSNNWDFYSQAGSSNNTIITTLFTDTRASFTYSGNIKVNSSSSPAGDPSGYLNISKYLNITNTSAAWVFLNISYTLSDIAGINESSLLMWRHTGTAWENVSGTNGVDTSNNYVYANLTNFSVFAPMGQPDTTPPTITVTSPTDTTYTSSSVALKVTADETINTWWYSLDGEANVTFVPNTTLSGLSNAQHNITVYANDTAGNVGSGGAEVAIESWNATYDNGSIDEAYGVAVDGSGNVYVTGESYLGADFDYYTIKYNSSGDEVWNASYDGGGGVDHANSVAVDGSGNVYVTGYSNLSGDADYYTIKYDSDGIEVWNRTYDNGSTDKATGIVVDSSGNVYVTGYSSISGNYNYYTIKYDSSGNVLWNATYDSGDYDEANGIAVDGSGNVYVTGASYISGGNEDDYYTIKYDSSGNEVWNRSYDGGNGDVGLAVAVDDSGNVYVTGSSTLTGDGDYYTLKYNSSGNVVWTQTYNGGGVDHANSIAVDGSGNVYVTGASRLGGNDDYYTIKYNSSGSEVWHSIYDNGSTDGAHGVAVNGSGYVYVTGYSNLSGNEDYHTIKYSQEEGPVYFTVDASSYTPPSGGGGGGGTPPAEDQETEATTVTPTEADVVAQVEATFSSISKDKTGTIAIPETENMPLTEMAIKVKSQVSNVKVVVKTLTSKPAETVQDIAGEVLRYLKIDHENIENDDIDEVTIRFKVEKTWIAENNIDAVVLNRFSNDTWNALTTTKDSEDSDYVYYSANSSGLSVFGISGQVQTATTMLPVTAAAPAIVAQATTAPPTTAPPEESKSPVGKILALVVIAIIAGATYYVYRKKNVKGDEVEKAPPEEQVSQKKEPKSRG